METYLFLFLPEVSEVVDYNMSNSMEKEFSPHPPATRIIYDGGEIYVQGFKVGAELTISHGNINEKFIPTICYIFGCSERKGFREPTSVNPPSIEAAIFVSYCHISLKEIAIITLVPRVQSRPVSRVSDNETRKE